MSKLLLIHFLLWNLSASSVFRDILLDMDHFFEGLDKNGYDLDKKVTSFKMLVKRSYNLDREEEHTISKRSLINRTSLYRDKQGVYILNNIQDAAVIPIKFPNDLALVKTNKNGLYAVGLEANKNLPHLQLANDLVIFEIGKNEVREVSRIPVLGGSLLAHHSHQNVTYILPAEYEAGESGQLTQGSNLYKLTENGSTVNVEKVQTLDIFHPRDVKIWNHLEELYLAVATEKSNNRTTSNLLIYKWLGQHFDDIQEIRTNDVKCVTPFSIGSFMFLAVANYQDEHGFADVSSEIYRFHLQNSQFKVYQKIPTRAATDVKYFSFKDAKSQAEEHFLIYLNSFNVNSDGSRNYESNSVMYKFDGDYFVPFQSFKIHNAKQWLPVKGPHGEFLLLATSDYGVVGYQYDGWRFVEKSVRQFDQKAIGTNIKSARAYHYFGETLLAFADKSNPGKNSNLWKVSFEKRNDLNEEYEEIENWCREMEWNLTDTEFQKASVLNVNDKSIAVNVNSSLKFENVEVDVLETESFETLDANLLNELNELHEEVKLLEILMQEINSAISTENDVDFDNVVDSVDLPLLELNCSDSRPCVLKNLQIGQLNGENWNEFTNNVVYLDGNLSFGSKLEFENVTVKNDVSPAFVNDHPSNTLVNVNSECLLNADLIIDGTVVVIGDLFVNGSFNGIGVDNERILLNEGRQDFGGKLSVSSASVENLDLSGKMNGVDLDKLSNNPPRIIQNNYAELNVYEMVVSGLISGHDFKDINENVLRRTGDQNIEGKALPSIVMANDIDVDSDSLSGIELKNLIRVGKKDNCTFDSDLVFERNKVDIYNLTIESLNSIPINDFPKTDLRSNEDLIASEILIVEGNLIVRDLIDAARGHSLLSIITNGVKINETKIDSKLIFSDVKANNLIVDAVDGSPVSSWVSVSSAKPEFISAKKIFEGDVTVREKLNVETINGIDLEELERDAFKLEGEQNVTGNVHFDEITCNRMIAEKAYVGNENWTEATFKPKKAIIDGSVAAGKLDVENLTVLGLIDDHSFEEILEDSIFGEKDVISGEKILTGRVTAREIQLEGSLNDVAVEEFFESDSNESHEIVTVSELVLKSLKVDDLHFEGDLNSVSEKSFGKDWLLTDGDQTIDFPIGFENVRLKNGSRLRNKIINKVNLQHLFQRSLKIDGNETIRTLESIGEIAAKEIGIGGKMNGRNFGNSVFLSESSSPQTLIGDWLFGHDLIVNGSLTIEGLVSGLNVSHLCSLKTDEEDVDLIVDGSVKLVKEPKILGVVNGINITSILEQVWFGNENTTLTGKVQRLNKIELNDEIKLKGYLNKINLTNLATNYFSKTSNKFVTSDMKFNGILVKNLSRIRNATVKGSVNGIDLDRFSRNVLLENGDQVLTGRIRFEKIYVDDLKLNGTVNEWDLKKDVLRYDVENSVVLGEKTFQSLMVQDLFVEPGKTVQGVSITDWNSNSVTAIKNHTLMGSVTFNSVELKKNLIVSGKLNGLKFNADNILTVNGNRVVTGYKNFELEKYPEKTMKMKSLNVVGSTGEVHFNSLIENQAYKNKDLIFTKPINFTNGIKTHSVSVNGLFVNENLTETIRSSLRESEITEMDRQFEDLLNETKRLERRMNERAYYLDHYEIVQTLKPNWLAVLPYPPEKEQFLLSAFTKNEMKTMVWSEFEDAFVFTDRFSSVNATFVSSEVTPSNSYVFVEAGNGSSITKSGRRFPIDAKNTSCVTSFELKSLNKSCFFIGQKWNDSRILCDNSLRNGLNTYQRLETEGSEQASALVVDDESYLVVIDKERVKDKIENTINVYRFDDRLQQFQRYQEIPEINPVAISTIFYKKRHYLVSAGGHLPGTVHSSIVSIFVFNHEDKAFLRYQWLSIDAPVDVKFSVLPSSELVLYVATSNPTKPFVVFSYKGVRGFVEETSGLSGLVLRLGTKIHALTDNDDRHFVVVSGQGRGDILRAAFKGGKSRK